MEIFIGRIPPSLGIREINEIFAPYGATNVRMLDGKGCAFANFESTFDGERAIAELNGHSVGGGQLNVKRASNKSSGGPPPSLPPPTPPAPRRENGVGSFGSPSVAAPASTPQPQLFIGRLPPNTSLHEIENAVLPYGAMNVKLLEGKNCAFAFFESWAQAEHCIAELNGAPLREGTEGLNVKLADLKGAPKGAQQEPKVFIGGIAPTVGQVEVQQACEQFGTVVDCKIFKKNDRSMPCAFVTFGSFTEAERCIQDLHESLNPLAAEGKALVAKMADMAKSQRTPPVPPLPTRERFDRVEPPRTFFNPAPIPVLPYPPVPSFEGRKGGYGGQPMHVPAPHPMHPVHPAPGPQGGGGLNDMPPAGGGMEDEKLFIGGLPASVSDEFLWGMMAPYGRVAEVKILRKSGAAPCGFVSFASMGEAEIALKALANCRFIVKYADSKGTKRPASVAFEDAFERRVR